MPLVAILAGDGIGPEVTAEARRVLEALELDLTFEEAPVGGAGYEAAGHPLPPETLALARRADAILFGAIGDPRYEKLDRHLRPEAALLGLRSALGLFANIRPATIFPALTHASSLKPDVSRPSTSSSCANSPATSISATRASAPPTQGCARATT